MLDCIGVFGKFAKLDSKIHNFQSTFENSFRNCPKFCNFKEFKMENKYSEPKIYELQLKIVKILSYIFRLRVLNKIFRFLYKNILDSQIKK